MKTAMDKLPKRDGDRAGSAFDDMGSTAFAAGWIVVLVLCGLAVWASVAGIDALIG